MSRAAAAVRTVFSEGFRAFFLGAGLFAVVAMAIWWGWLLVQAAGGIADLPPAVPPFLWHGHEMVFGYGAAALGGFFLTAVPNWTGAKAAPHRFVALAFGLWLVGRLAMWFGGSLPAGLIALADLAFVPLLGAKILTQLLQRPKPQNMVFLAVLAVYWLANLSCHLEWMGLPGGDVWVGLRAGLVALAAMIVVLGGRVTPGFTRNAMVQSGREWGLPVNPAPLALAAGLSSGLLPLAYLLRLPDAGTGALAVLAGGLALARVALWRGGWTLDRPILWIMHLSYGLNGLGLALLGLAGLGLGSEVAGLHVLAIGGVGGMTLAMMSRATLGHAGRPLIAPGPVAWAYAFLPLAALARWAGSAFPALYTPAVLVAGGLWLAAFALYLAGLLEVFVTPRASRSKG